MMYDSGFEVVPEPVRVGFRVRASLGTIPLCPITGRTTSGVGFLASRLLTCSTGQIAEIAVHVG